MQLYKLNLFLNNFGTLLLYPPCLSRVAEDKSFLIQFKIQLADKRYRSISKVQSCDIKNYETLLDNFELSWDIKDDTYNQLPVDYIIFVYRLPAAEEKWNLIKINKPIDNQIVNKEHMVINKTKKKYCARFVRVIIVNCNLVRSIILVTICYNFYW